MNTTRLCRGGSPSGRNSGGDTRCCTACTATGRSTSSAAITPLTRIRRAPCVSARPCSHSPSAGSGCGVSQRSTKLVTASSCAARSRCPGTSRAACTAGAPSHCASAAPRAMRRRSACGLSCARRASSAASAAGSCVSHLPISRRSASSAWCSGVPSACSACAPSCASTSVTSASSRKRPRSSGDSTNSCRIGPGSARPLVSTTTRRNAGSSPRRTPRSRRSSASARSART